MNPTELRGERAQGNPSSIVAQGRQWGELRTTHGTELAERAPKSNRLVGLYVDADNLFIRTREALGRDVRLNYAALVDYARSFGPVVDAVVYLSRTPKSTGPSGLEFFLKRCGLRVVSRNRFVMSDGKEKSVADVSLALDVGAAMADGAISYYIVASGDGSFIPICERSTALGAVIEVVGPDRGTSGHLFVAATRFTPVSEVPGLVVPAPEGRQNPTPLMAKSNHSASGWDGVAA